MKQCFEHLISLLKLILKSGAENEGIKLHKCMKIKKRYQNLFHSSDFLCVLVMNY